MNRVTELLTASRILSFTSCQRKHFWRYEQCLKRETPSVALRIGAAWHRAMEARWNGLDYSQALEAAIPDSIEFDPLDAVKVAGLLSGYYSHWKAQDDHVETFFSETEFRHPIHGSRSFEAAGKIDGLAQLGNGRLILVESKTTSDSVDPDSDYWLRLRFNPQLLQYVIAARNMGWNVDEIMYDVTRKPSISQKKTESVEEYGDRLVKDTADRPDFYFARRMVPVLEDDIAEFEALRLSVGRSILFNRRAGVDKPWLAWPRHIDMVGCRMCEFSSFCLQNINPTPGAPPPGFVKGQQHDELNNA